MDSLAFSSNNMLTVSLSSRVPYKPTFLSQNAIGQLMSVTEYVEWGYK